MKSKVSLKEDIKTIFCLSPYSNFTPMDLFYDLVILHDYDRDKLEVADIKEVLNELKIEGFIFNCNRKEHYKKA